MFDNYVDLITVEDEEKLEQEAQLEHVRNSLIRLEMYPDLPEDFDLHVEFYGGEH